MKTLLVPTDFSEEAGYALQAAHQLARKLQAALRLVHVLEFPMDDVETPVPRIKTLPVAFLREAKQEALARLGQEAQRADLTQVPVETKVLVGNPYLSITRELVGDPVDLVVMGSRGASGLQEILVGSNAERMVRFARCPVLVIKETTNLENMRHIVFATSLQEAEFRVLSHLQWLRQAFHAHLHLLRVNTLANFLHDQYVQRTLTHLAQQSKLDHYTVHTFSDLSEEDGILHFADEIGADLIAMATHGRRGILHLLSGSVAEDVVNHARRPIWTMSLHS